jgi:hypothetical protein
MINEKSYNQATYGYQGPAIPQLAGGSITAAQVKNKLLENDDTQVLTDAEKVIIETLPKSAKRRSEWTFDDFKATGEEDHEVFTKIQEAIFEDRQNSVKIGVDRVTGVILPVGQYNIPANYVFNQPNMYIKGLSEAGWNRLGSSTNIRERALINIYTAGVTPLVQTDRSGFLGYPNHPNAPANNLVQDAPTLQGLTLGAIGIRIKNFDVRCNLGDTLDSLIWMPSVSNVHHELIHAYGRAKYAVLVDNTWSENHTALKALRPYLGPAQGIQPEKGSVSNRFTGCQYEGLWSFANLGTLLSPRNNVYSRGYTPLTAVATRTITVANTTPPQTPPMAGRKPKEP